MFWEEPISTDVALDVLNAHLALNRESFTRLFTTMVFFNKDLASHRTIQVHAFHEGCFSVPGMRESIIRCFGTGPEDGLFGVREDSYGPISVVQQEDGQILRFERRLPEKEA